MSTEDPAARVHDEWFRWARIAAWRVLRNRPTTLDEVDELTAIGLVALAQLDHDEKLDAMPPGLIVSTITLDIIDELRRRNGRGRGRKEHVGALSLDPEAPGMGETFAGLIADPTLQDEIDRVAELDEARQLRERLDRMPLPRSERRVVEAFLALGGQCSHADVARRTGVSEGRVSQVLMRVRARFPKAP